MLAVAVLALQLFFLLRIALMMVVARVHHLPAQRDLAPRWSRSTSCPGRRSRCRDARISDNLRRAVIASEDAGFVEHPASNGTRWRRHGAEREGAGARRGAADARARGAGATASRARWPPKVVGGSTISQQLAKNLFLSGERNIVRKGQELVITYMLEACWARNASSRPT